MLPGEDLSRPAKVQDQAAAPLYPRLLGSAWSELDPAVRGAHLSGERLRRVGRFKIERGSGWLARLLGTILRLPDAAEDIETELLVTRAGDGERWERRFGGTALVTLQRANRRGLHVERTWFLELNSRLEVDRGRLVHRHVGTALRLGPLPISLPRWLAPRVEGSESPDGLNRTRVSVSVALPLVGPLISYQGFTEEP